MNGNGSSSGSLYPPVMAKFYDLIYDQVRSHVDHDFYLQRIMETRGPVLEVGSGTGRLLKDALARKADIYGIDISESMLKILKSKIPVEEHYRISCQSITDFVFEKKFKMILAPFRVFMHLTEIPEQTAALNHIAQYLENDGLFIFDVFVPNIRFLNEGTVQFSDFDGEYEPGKRMKRFIQSDYDVLNQRINLEMKFRWEENDQWLEDTWRSQMRFFWRYELELLIAASGLSLVTIYGDFQKGALDYSSQDFIVVCKRKNG